MAEIKVDNDYVSSGFQVIDDLSLLLGKIAAPFLTRTEGQTVLKALMIFAFETPVSVTENLFNMDQVSGTSSYNVNSLDRIKNRNWQWIFQCKIGGESGGQSVRELAWCKSKAVEMGRLMMMKNSSSENVRLIIGYWLQKLYEARDPKISFYQIPECVRTAYHQFLKWQGYEWRERRISSNEALQLVSSLYAAHKIKKTDVITRQFLMSEFWSNNNKTTKINDLCKGLGIKRLITMYLTQSFNGTLEEFRNNNWNK